MRDVIKIVVVTALGLVAWVCASVCFGATETEIRVAMAMAAAQPTTSPSPKPIPAPQRVEVGKGDHTCPNCGWGPWLVQNRRANGWHSHVCGRCGTEFWHPDADRTAPAPQRRLIQVRP